MFFFQTPKIIPDQLYNAVVEYKLNGLPAKKERSRTQSAAYFKWRDLQRHYGDDIQIGSWYNPITQEEESRVLHQGKLVLKESDVQLIAKIYRY